jgi:hypothetical protein
MLFVLRAGGLEIGQSHQTKQAPAADGKTTVTTGIYALAASSLHAHDW